MKKRSTKRPNKRRVKRATAPPNPQLPNWDNLEAKKQVFQDIIGEILLHPELGETYVTSDDLARKVFEAKINVPADFRIIFLRHGDSTTPGGGSAIIELPDPGTGTMSPDEKLEQFLCTYNPW